MKPDKLRNLLEQMDLRLRRTERSVVAKMQVGDNRVQSVVQQLSGLRAEIKRYLSKPDSIRLSDISDLEIGVSGLRKAAQYSLNDAQADLIPDLRLISEDGDSLLHLTTGMRIGLNQLGPEDVLELTPGQKPAAFQFGFAKDNLTVVDQPFRPKQMERDMAIAAFEAAVSHGEYVNQDLERSNVSPRLRDAFLRLQAIMESYKNIVQVGSCAQMCNRLVNADAAELSNSQFGLLIGHIEMVFTALAQFEEWRIFSENAIAANLDIGSVAKLTQTTRSLAKELENSGAVDQSVPDALTTVSDWVEDQAVPDRRDVLSLSRTLENVWSWVTKTILGLSKDVVSEARKMTARAILVSLLGVGSLVVPFVSSVQGSQWIQTAFTYFTAGGAQPPKVP